MSSQTLKTLARRMRQAGKAYDLVGGPVTNEKYGIELFEMQHDMVRLVEGAIDRHDGGVYTIKSSRQSGKNEVAGLIQARMLGRYHRRGGIAVRCAPTYRPQIVRSKQRLEKYLRKGITPDWQPKEGYQYHCGAASINFLSTDPKANVVGDTASLLLDVDEAQDVDRTTFEVKFMPMTAFTNAPTVLWGVAGFGGDILKEYLEHNIEAGHPERNLRFPAPVWCEVSPEYAKHFEERVAKHGEAHPFIQTQYLLNDMSPQGVLFRKNQIRNVLAGSHARQTAPRDWCYVITIDIAGEQEEEITDPYLKVSAGRDSTVALVWEVDLHDVRHGWVKARLVDTEWWVGKKYQESGGIEGQQELLLQLLQKWNPMEVVVDARGLGDQIAKYLDNNYGAQCYYATAQSVTRDVFDTLAMMNNDRIQMWSPDQSEEWMEFKHQLETCDYKVSGQGNMNLKKPKGGHIDFMKAMSYLPRAVEPLQGMTLSNVGADPNG